MTSDRIESRSHWPIEPGLEALLSEQEAHNQQLESVPVPPAGAMPIEKIRQFRLYNADGSLKPKLNENGIDESITTPQGEIKLRRFQSRNANGVYLHFHGGGWVMGSVYEQDELLWSLAQATNLTVISVDYPLAPESALPDIIRFVIRATKALMQAHSEQAFCIGGESAGSYLALQAALGIAAEPELLGRVAALNLCYGIYDVSMTPSQIAWGDRMLGLSTDYLAWFYDLALPDTSTLERRDESISPLYKSNLAKMPPALFTIGEYDPLLDDSLFMAARWAASGNVSELKVYPRSPHGFNGMPTGMAAKANAEIHQFIASHFNTAA